MNNQQQQGGIGCLSIVGVVFIVLKVLGVSPVASWTWTWVLAPFWVPFAISLIFMVIFWGIVATATRGDIKITRR